MTSKNCKQLSISNYFSPKANNENNHARNGLEVNNSGALKRSNSFGTDDLDVKRPKINGNSSENGSIVLSPVKNKCSTSPSTKSKLDSFRFKGDTTTKHDREDIFATDSLIVRNHKPFVVPKGVKLTPLETQVVGIKLKHPDTLLFVECGYKYRFFGDDAEIASKELNICANLDHNFLTASIPTHRLHVHVKRLVNKGYKVGVVKQTETAAVKAAGLNKSAPFTREIADLYTKATLIGEDVSRAGEADAESGQAEPTTSSLVILTEFRSEAANSDVGIAFVSIQPNTGEVSYDCFEDNATRTCLWSHLERIHPVEVIIGDQVSEQTQKVVNAMTVRHDDCIRIEKVRDEAFEYSRGLQSLGRVYGEDEAWIQRLMDLPKPVVGCLGATLAYLQEFRLERILRCCGDIKKCSSAVDYMLLPGPTLRNLELVVNATDAAEFGSLFWALNQTLTKFGARILRSWILRPLVNVEIIEDRLSMVEELMVSESELVHILREALEKLPDLEKSITSIFYKKCSPLEFWSTTSSFQRVHLCLSRLNAEEISNKIQNSSLQRTLQTIVEKLSSVAAFAENIDEESAKNNTKSALLKDWSEFEEVTQKRDEIASFEKKLDQLRPTIARTLNMRDFSYSAVSGAEYLIEVKNKDMKLVPKNWSKISSTKTCCRFRSKECEALYSKLQLSREQLDYECNKAWLRVLEKFSGNYQDYKDAVRSLGSLDALLSMAKVSQLYGFSRPRVTASDESFVKIVRGKHPIVSLLKNSVEYVANDTDLSSKSERVMLVTGPNMGGKSCYMRQVALIVVMAQMGSFVPAESVDMSVVDAIYTRMGSTDEIFTGQSTLMVEMNETSNIMAQATDKSLVILDEIGRGTSTHDGVAIATAALDFFLNSVKCLTVFVTHYLTLSEFVALYPGTVGNHHMAFVLNEPSDDIDDSVHAITFLYQLTSGDAGSSYGLNVARLASLPASVLKRATVMSSHLRQSSLKSNESLFEDVFHRHRRPAKEELSALLP